MRDRRRRGFAIEADVTKEADVARMIARALREAWAALDGLALNVGIGAGGPWLEGTTAESWDKVFADQSHQPHADGEGARCRSWHDGVVDRVHLLDRGTDGGKPLARL